MLSLPVSRSVYVPGTLKLACVSAAFALTKLTAPGPLSSVQVAVVAAGGVGCPSSLTLPWRAALAGGGMGRAGPAVAGGGGFGGGGPGGCLGGGGGAPAGLLFPGRAWRAALAGRVMVRSGPALTVGAVLGGGGPVVYSRWRRGAPAGLLSQARAVRWPVPVMIRASALPLAQPGRLTSSWAIAVRSGLRWFGPASPISVQGGGDQ